MPNASYQTIDTEVLIIGGGLAALARGACCAQRRRSRADAWQALDRAQRLIDDDDRRLCAGDAGLNDRDDSAELHYIDTIVGGGYVNERALVHALVDDAPARLRELWDYGVQFRKRNGQYHLSPSGDHSQARVFVPEHMRGIDLTLPLRQAALDAGVICSRILWRSISCATMIASSAPSRLARSRAKAVIVNARRDCICRWRRRPHVPDHQQSGRCLRQAAMRWQCVLVRACATWSSSSSIRGD